MPAVVRATASDPVFPRPAGPVRTCIGCRKRVAAADLLRVVVAPGDDGRGIPASVVPDPLRRIHGRGAWLHPDPGCVDLAERRRAYGRALRASAPLDPTPVREHLRSAASMT